MAPRSHPRGSTWSRGPANDQNGEVTQSLVDEYLADRITVTEMCNRINVQLNLFPDDSHSVEQVMSLGTATSDPGTTSFTAKLLFHPGWSEGVFVAGVAIAETSPDVSDSW